MPCLVRRHWVIAALVVLLALGAGITGLALHWTRPPESFSRIQVGMPLHNAEAILGGPGRTEEFRVLPVRGPGQRANDREWNAEGGVIHLVLGEDNTVVRKIYVPERPAGLVGRSLWELRWLIPF